MLPLTLNLVPVDDENLLFLSITLLYAELFPLNIISSPLSTLIEVPLSVGVIEFQVAPLSFEYDIVFVKLLSVAFQ